MTCFFSRKKIRIEWMLILYLFICLKWRGEWQAGIKCGRADWSLSALKSKPSSDQMKYVLIFSLDTRDLSWADILNVESIDKFPQPIPYKTHEEGLQMVKDLTIARRFQMQKLAVDMLSIVDQFHSNVCVLVVIFPLLHSLFL